MLESLEINPDFPLVNHLRFFSFSKDIKNRVNEEQNHECAMCHHRVTWMSAHHIVPEKALQRRGIKGKDVRENAVGFCAGEWGRGKNSPDDHHEVADRMAIDNNKFWHNGRFVDLSEIDPSTYIGVVRPFQERAPHNRHKERQRGHKHHR
jgi:hypothetical protein